MLTEAGSKKRASFEIVDAGRSIAADRRQLAFAGAHLGVDTWPAAWRTRIEYRDRLERLAALYRDGVEAAGW